MKPSVQRTGIRVAIVPESVTLKSNSMSLFREREPISMCLALPGKVVSLIPNPDPLLLAGKVSFGGIIKTVSLAYVPEVQPGDYVIVHVGFAISIVDQAEAEATLMDLEELDALQV